MTHLQELRFNTSAARACSRPAAAMGGSSAASLSEGELRNSAAGPFLPGDHWYCLHTRPNRETYVLRALQDGLGFPAYFPRLRQEKVIRRIRQQVTRPLFPRYLFCRFDAAQNFRMVRHTAEVIDVVRLGDRPAIVADGVIADLRSWAGDILDVTPLIQQLPVGAEVAIKSGPMQGLRAVIRHADSDRDRVAILLSSLEYQAQVFISRTQLERVG